MTTGMVMTIIIEPPKIHFLQSLALFAFGSIRARAVVSEWEEVTRRYKGPETLAELQREAKRLGHIDKSGNTIDVAGLLAQARAQA